MYKHLVLAAALGACTILPAPAAAHGHAPGHPDAVSTFDFRIILQDGPTFVDHRPSPRGYFRTQPWPPRFKHLGGRPRWHQPPRHHTRHFWFRDNGHSDHFKWSRDDGHRDHEWSRDHDRHRFGYGRRKGWAHGRAHHHGQHNRFRDRHHRR